MRDRRAEAVSCGVVDAMIALTTAMPSRCFDGVLDWKRMRWMFVELTPPMQTVGRAAWVLDTVARMRRRPDMPMMDLVSRLL